METQKEKLELERWKSIIANDSENGLSRLKRYICSRLTAYLMSHDYKPSHEDCIRETGLKLLREWAHGLPGYEEA